MINFEALALRQFISSLNCVKILLQYPKLSCGTSDVTGINNSASYLSVALAALCSAHYLFLLSSDEEYLQFAKSGLNGYMG